EQSLGDCRMVLAGELDMLFIVNEVGFSRPIIPTPSHVFSYKKPSTNLRRSNRPFFDSIYGSVSSSRFLIDVLRRAKVSQSKMITLFSLPRPLPRTLRNTKAFPPESVMA